MRSFEKIKYLLRKKLTLYPALTGIIFLINELRKNAIFYTLTESIYLILIILSFTLIVDFITRKLIKDKTKAAFIATSFICINLFYQDIFFLILNHNFFKHYIESVSSNLPEFIIIPAIILIWVAFAFFVLRTKLIISKFNFYFNVLTIVLMLIEFAQWMIIPIPRIILADNIPFPVNVNLSREQKPDIYYIILDEYTSSKCLKRDWNYDNSEFEDSLKRLGFRIAANSKSDFTSTLYCLSSYLNSSSLIFSSTKKYNERNLIELIRDNRMYAWLMANNYTCRNYSLFDAFGKKKYYTSSFNYDHFLGRTIWYTNIFKVRNYFSNTLPISKFNLKIFTKLNCTSKKRSNEPKFTYAHIILPHAPYVFNKNGKLFQNSDSLTDKQKYLNQLIFTNSLTLKSINNILTNSKNRPIIIIQGDHGFRSLNDTSTIEKSDVAHSIFYAIYSSNEISIPDSINPLTSLEKIVTEINHQ